MKKIILLAFAIGGLVTNVKAQSSSWSAVASTNSASYPHFSFKLNDASFINIVQGAGNSNATSVSIELPSPEGKVKRFKIWRNTLIPAELQAKFANVWAFSGVAEESNRVTIKLEYSHRGLHAMVYDGAATYFIDPISPSNTDAYKAYYKSDATMDPLNQNACLLDETMREDARDNSRTELQGFTFGSVKRTYRLALSCTGEYAVAVAGASATKTDVFAAMTTTMNRVNGIYERELAITMQFIPNNDTIIFTNPTTDPFTANNNGGQLLSQNQSSTTARVGAANYDIGHIFSTGAGGIASLAGVCRNNRKAQGVTGRPNPVGDPFDVDYVAHEMGHQFGAEHTFNKCSGTEEQTTAYEPGGGTTIMAYAGICGTVNNIQLNSDDYFHRVSLDDINYWIQSGQVSSCATNATGNDAPNVVVIPETFLIPIGTPFELDFPNFTAIDTANALLGNLDQYDLGNFRQDESGGANFVNGPVYRSMKPSEASFRSFPDYYVLRAGYLEDKGQRAISVARNFKFAFTAREIYNDGWGAINSADVYTNVSAVANTGPFRILYPSIQDSILRNSTTTIYWDVANSNLAPINCATVDVYLSTDGGFTFPIVLAQNVPNTGSADVAIPDLSINNARIKIKASDNVFFSFSSKNVVIGDVATIYDTTTSTNIPNVALEAGVDVYPNPASDILNVKLEANAKDGNLTLINAIGQEVWKGIIKQQNRNLQINTSAMAKGIYMLRFVNTDGQSVFRKVVLK